MFDLVTDAMTDALLYLFISTQHSTRELMFHVNASESGPSLCTNDTLPNLAPGFTRIIIVSDTHDRHQGLGKLPEGDLFIHCGDIFMTNRFYSHEASIEKLKEFNNWLSAIPCKHRVVLAGNHDLVIERLGKDNCQKLFTNATYLENSHYTLGKLKFWGCPISKGKSKNRAFQTKEFRDSSLASAPESIDILITHGRNIEVERKVKHLVHIWGHHHQSYGVHRPGEVLRGEPIEAFSICAPIMNAKYKLSNLPIVFDIPSDPLDFTCHPQSINLKQLLRDHRDGLDKSGTDKKSVLTIASHSSAATLTPGDTGVLSSNTNIDNLSPTANTSHIVRKPIAITRLYNYISTNLRTRIVPYSSSEDCAPTPR